MLTFILLAVGACLVLFMLLRIRREDLKQPAGVASNDRKLRDDPHALQPREFAFRIFSRQDREFIFSMRSPRLLTIYQQERRKVALHWVRQTSREVSKIMRTHRLTSRQSHNLNMATEADLLIQYLKLQILCGLLIFLIEIFGPHALNDLATYAGELYQRIGRALSETAAANRVAPSETVSLR
jgi:hypothetical protein